MSPEDPAEHPDRPPVDGGHFDVVVIGSGFGGAMAALPLVEAGARVLMLERGDWVARGEHSRDLGLAWKDRPAYCRRTPYPVRGEGKQRLGAFHCVGGASVYYGGVALRFRSEDFEGSPEITGDVRWPFGYEELRPYYRRAEELLGVSGDTGDDPTAPPRRTPLPPPGIELSPTSRALRDAAKRRGLHPFHVPVALNDDGSRTGALCTACGTCDGFACFLGAKNDLATVLIPRLLGGGMSLRPRTVAVRLTEEDGRVAGVDALDRDDRRRLHFRADHFVVAAGALGTPHLLLASGLERLNPAGDSVGRYLMRHCNAIVGGFAPRGVGDPADFRKQIGINDFYFGDGSASAPPGRLGAIQQLRATRIGLAELPIPGFLARALQPLVDRSMALIVMAEDQPNRDNRVRVSRGGSDAFGRPIARVEHRYSDRDRAARRALEGHARAILKEAGAPFTVRKVLTTFSHALGTVRMGRDPTAFPVDTEGRFRGLPNLRITDASIFPTAAAVNPSLTISANALRIGAALALEMVGATASSASGPGDETGELGRSPEPRPIGP